MLLLCWGHLVLCLGLWLVYIVIPLDGLSIETVADR
jgi:hypothetical protein